MIFNLGFLPSPHPPTHTHTHPFLLWLFHCSLCLLTPGLVWRIKEVETLVSQLCSTGGKSDETQINGTWGHLVDSSKKPFHLFGRRNSQWITAVCSSAGFFTPWATFSLSTSVYSMHIEHIQCARHRIWKRDAKLNKTWSLSSLEGPLTPWGDTVYKHVIIIQYSKRL